MIDLQGLRNGDLVYIDTNLIKAKSVMEVQEGSLEYLPEFGVDYKYFIQSDIQYQKENLQGHIMDRLSLNLVPPDTISSMSDLLSEKLLIGIKNKDN